MEGCSSDYTERDRESPHDGDASATTSATTGYPVAPQWVPVAPTRLELLLAKGVWPGLGIMALGPLLVDDWRVGIGMFTGAGGMVVFGLMADAQNKARQRIRSRLAQRAPITGE